MDKASTTKDYPFRPGDLVSTEHRFRRRDDYKQAVLGAGGKYDESKHSCSIELPGGLEKLLMHQPSHNYLSDCVLEFRFSAEQNLRLFQDNYDRRTKYQGYKEIEYPGQGFRGEQDKADTYRAIILLPHRQGKKLTTDDYEASIINPPYPRRRQDVGKAMLTTFPTHRHVFGVLGLAAGVVLVLGLRKNMRQR